MPRALSENSFAGNTVVEQLLKCSLKYVTQTWSPCPGREGMRSRKLEVVDCEEMKPGGRHGWRTLFLCLSKSRSFSGFISRKYKHALCVLESCQQTNILEVYVDLPSRHRVSFKLE